AERDDPSSSQFSCSCRVNGLLLIIPIRIGIWDHMAIGKQDHELQRLRPSVLIQFGLSLVDGRLQLRSSDVRLCVNVFSNEASVGCKTPYESCALVNCDQTSLIIACI